MSKRTPDFLKRTQNVTSRMATQDRQVDDRRAEERGALNSIHIDRIRHRSSDTRTLTDEHVTSLKESIAVLGLIEPLAVDQDKVLLAGGHRLAAIALLRMDDQEAYALHFPDEKIPVRSMPFSAADDPEKALQVEIAENEHRRDYTPAEVRRIAEHLRQAGYREGRGRPKPGEKSLMPALSVVIGKSNRTLQRYLHPLTEKNQTDVRIYLKKARKSLIKWQEEASPNKADPALIESLPKILELLDTALSDDVDK